MPDYKKRFHEALVGVDCHWQWLESLLSLRWDEINVPDKEKGTHHLD